SAGNVYGSQGSVSTTGTGGGIIVSAGNNLYFNQENLSSSNGGVLLLTAGNDLTLNNVAIAHLLGNDTSTSDDETIVAGHNATLSGSTIKTMNTRDLEISAGNDL